MLNTTARAARRPRRPSRASVWRRHCVRGADWTPPRDRGRAIAEIDSERRASEILTGVLPRRLRPHHRDQRGDDENDTTGGPRVQELAQPGDEQRTRRAVAVAARRVPAIHCSFQGRTRGRASGEARGSRASRAVPSARSSTVLASPRALPRARDARTVDHQEPELPPPPPPPTLPPEDPPPPPPSPENPLPPEVDGSVYVLDHELPML
jgi:hypothetical protein